MALLLVPLLALLSIWAFATAITVQEARHLLAVSAVFDTLGKPAEAVVQAVQEERRQAVVYLADPRNPDSAMTRSQQATDEAVGELRRRAAAGARDDLPAGGRENLDLLLEKLGQISLIRDQVATHTITRNGALDEYRKVTEQALRFQAALFLLDNVELDRHGRAVVGLAQAAEHLSRADALVAGALAAGPAMTGQERRALTDRIAERRLSYDLYLADLPDRDRQAHQRFWQGGQGVLLTGLEEQVVADGVAGVQPGQWEETNRDALRELRALAVTAGDNHQDRVGPAARAVLVRAGAAAVLGLLAVLISVTVSWRIGRTLVRDLRTLWTQAKEAAEVRLPGVMRRLAEGERIDAATEAPLLEYGKDEVGQVGQALNTLQRAAVEAAVKQAEVRRGVSDVFVNLARRSQVLLHKQLSLLDAMERRTDDADELADLFRIDHLTTRMRRHAEGLMILSGAGPARQWRNPVQLMDVVRGAVAEVEDYERIEVRRLPRLAVDGRAVADLTHLVAELLENATAFSPPHTAVQVTGEDVPNGFSLEIHDRGLGMTAEAAAEANRRLAENPEFDITDTSRLGLFVVARLARRHDVRVSLRESPYGGTTAVVLLPQALLSEVPEGAAHAPLPERPAPPTLLNGPVDGPVELEAPVRLPQRLSREDRPAPAGAAYDDSVQHAPLDEPPPPAVPLPQRPHAPVLVADHGRFVNRGRDGRDLPARGARRDTPEYPDMPDIPDARPSSGRPADSSVPPSAGASAQPPGTGSSTGSGLPRRVPGAGPGPLRRATRDHAAEHPSGADADAASDAPGPGPAPVPPEPDAEVVRLRLASFQRGSQRGREQAERRTGRPPSGRGGEEAGPEAGDERP
ncbi:sensor histidine kinase [Streptomyces aidingensis]|uniref:histidine kinase n=1 Tax=Streptomyces aidingensis TaxID=910347 RepID=A0A1I1PFA7_9ACTN|nr:nitrate- and nitrite sensing domain-containing protein [Streptomyces aidingensis]SFD08509.1 Signal transduction histidine kinase [Streptomyces aidingensis]